MTGGIRRSASIKRRETEASFTSSAQFTHYYAEGIDDALMFLYDRLEVCGVMLVIIISGTVLCIVLSSTGID